MNMRVRTDLAALLAERKAVVGGQARYRYDLVQAARAFWDGGSLDEWITEMDQVVQEGLWRAWLQGAASVGVEEGDLNEEEQARFGEIVNEQMSYIDAFGFFIQDLRQREQSFDAVLTRLELWANTYTEVVNEARVVAGRDTKLKWVLGPVKTEHCESCLKLEGRVYRASTWDKFDIRPQHPLLTCGGWNCACTLRPTDEPCDKGRPPGLP